MAGGGARYATDKGDKINEIVNLMKSESKLFPNPANICVNLTGMDYNVSSIQAIVLVSTLGVEKKQLMYSESDKHENTLNIDLDGVSPGIYFLKTISDSHERVYRIIVGGL